MRRSATLPGRGGIRHGSGNGGGGVRPVMSYDELVWLVVGLGLGVGGTLMWLMLLAATEGWRLRRRIRRARKLAPVVAAAPPALVTRAAPVSAARPAPKPMTPAPVSAPAPKPAQTPALAPMPTPAPVAVPAPAPAPIPAPSPVESVIASPITAAVVALPAEEPVAKTAPAPVAPKPAQSVEAMFAEAFAIDRLTVEPKVEEGKS